MRVFTYLSYLSALCSLTQAQFPPTPQGVTTLQSQILSGASLSYKQTHICETTPGVHSYSGYVNLPANVTGESFNISTFYWYFSARHSPETAPLIIYLAGGAGESSLDGVNGEGGPCLINDDSNSTTLNPWSWNQHANMLYIDQPVQAGFSYDKLVNGTFDTLQNVITPIADIKGVHGNATTIVGTFASQDPLSTSQGSGRGAAALWYFMQVFVDKFPLRDVKEKKLSIWGNSWAGFYIPPTFAHFIRQNDRIRAKNLTGHIIPLDTVGITNGCIDPLIEAPQYIQMARNNTYGLVAYNDTILAGAEEALNGPEGCKNLIANCREMAALGDPDYNGLNSTVNTACVGAFNVCFGQIQGAFTSTGSNNRSAFDISHPVQDPFPNYRAAGYFNQAWVQAALGVPVNFTEVSSTIANVYLFGVGDAIRLDISNLDFVLQRDYQVVMAFGDRDYRCNWLGGEAISLAAKWNHTADFNNAGYASIHTNASYDGGYVRQAGRFAFARIFQAGHAVHAYQPETMFQVFSRAMSGHDVATGRKKIYKPSKLYTTIGPHEVRNATILPPMPEPVCYTWAAGGTCTDNQIEALMAGTAVQKDYFVIDPTPEVG